VGKTRKEIIITLRTRWQDNIKTDFTETCLEGASWINLSPDRDKWRAVVNTVMNIWAPQNAGYMAPKYFSANYLSYFEVSKPFTSFLGKVFAVKVEQNR
jgi:hypothetical protein